MSLLDKITRHIQHTGPMGIAEFMMLCLYDDEYGYYKNHKPIGADGDFITAPEISQMFGEMIGVWVISAYQNLGAPANFRLIELGAGRGTLLKDVMRVLKSQNIDDAAQIEIVESNQELRKLQKSALETYEPIWHDEFVNIPKNEIPIILIANEFLDCFPIRQFVKLDTGWHERLIGIGEKGLEYGLGPKLVTLPLNAKDDDKIGTIVENAIGLEGFFSNLGEIFQKTNGHALFIDYGHFGDEIGDSFQALYKHQKSNPLENLGQSDLTAHVNFAQVEQYAIANNFSINGLDTQRELLIALGIEERAKNLMQQNPSKTQEISNSLKRLIDQEAMGELFKAIIISKEPNI